MDINLTQRLKSKMAPRARVRNRYSSSEMYGIVNGWITPKQWFNPPEKNMKELLNMWNGTGMHNQLEELMGVDNSEKKIEYLYKNIVLVGKADFLPVHKPEEVWEFKTSENVMDQAKPWHEYQAKLYTTLFNRKQGLVFQPVQNDQGLFLRHIGTVERDDTWFIAEIEKLYVFHLKVEEIWQEQEPVKIVSASVSKIHKNK